MALDYFNIVTEGMLHTTDHPTIPGFASWGLLEDVPIIAIDYQQNVVYVTLKKNVAGQLLYVYAWNTTSGAPETGDAANITCQQSIDGAAFVDLTDTNPAEVDAVRQKGFYKFTLEQTETNGDEILFIATSSTADVSIHNVFVFTEPAYYLWKRTA